MSIKTLALAAALTFAVDRWGSRSNAYRRRERSEQHEQPGQREEPVAEAHGWSARHDANESITAAIICVVPKCKGSYKGPVARLLLGFYAEPS